MFDVGVWYQIMAVPSSDKVEKVSILQHQLEQQRKVSLSRLCGVWRYFMPGEMFVCGPDACLVQLPWPGKVYVSVFVCA